MKFALHVLILAIVGAGCSTTKISSRRTLSTEESTWATTQRLPFVIGVVPAESISPTNKWEICSVSNLATNLIRTGLFNSVVVGNRSSDVDVTVKVSKTYGVLRCGTGLPFTKATLGLYRDDVAYTYVYDFEFASPHSGAAMTFKQYYQGNCRIGFWPARDDGFVELLRFDLLKQRQEIEGLTHR